MDEFEGKKEKGEGKKINELETIIQTGISTKRKDFKKIELSLQDMWDYNKNLHMPVMRVLE